MVQPSPNPTHIYKWEDASSLEHACWACPTKANSPKALHSCYGIHSMPCLAYHSTMHAIGSAHRCSACSATREIHDNRHREIARLVSDYHMFLDAENSALNRYRERRTLRERPINVPHQEQDLDALNEAEDGEVDAQEQSDKEDNDDDNMSSTETLSVATSGETNVAKLTKAEQRERKKVSKAQKSQNKAAKNQARHCLQLSVEDIDRVNRVLHGVEADARRDTHPLATDTAIEEVIARNLGFVKQIESHKEALKEQVVIGRKEDKERRRNKRQINEGIRDDTETEAILEAILLKLGIEKSVIAETAATNSLNHQHEDLHSKLKHKRNKSHPKTPSRTPPALIALDNGVGGGTPGSHSHAGGSGKKAPRSKAVIVQKLRDAIKDDFEKHENELRQAYIRAGGFFRYTGRQIFERMTEIASRIDVQTGEEWEKKLKRESLRLAAAIAPVLPQEQNEEDDLHNREHDQADH